MAICPALHYMRLGYIHGRSGAKTRRCAGPYSATSASQRLGGLLYSMQYN